MTDHEYAKNYIGFTKNRLNGLKNVEINLTNPYDEFAFARHPVWIRLLPDDNPLKPDDDETGDGLVGDIVELLRKIPKKGCGCMKGTMVGHSSI